MMAASTLPLWLTVVRVVVRKVGFGGQLHHRAADRPRSAHRRRRHHRRRPDQRRQRRRRPHRGLRAAARGDRHRGVGDPAARRPRYSNRNVKCSTSRYHARDDGRPALPTTIVTIDITVRTPPINLAPTRRPRTRQGYRRPHEQRQLPPGAVRPATRRERVTAVLLSEPRHDWHGAELAQLLQINQHLLLTQLSEWARLGFLQRTGKGTYALDTPPPGWPPPNLTLPPLPGPPGAEVVPDGDEERGNVQRPQRSQDERPCPVTSGGHTPAAPGSHDTPAATSWT